MNEVKLQGEVTYIKEVKETVVKFTIKAEKSKGFAYVPLVAFGDVATLVINGFTKGDIVRVLAEISTGSYEKEGKKIYTTDIVALKVAKA